MARKIILCDDCKTEEISQKAREYGYGIEVQTFHKPALCEDKEQISLHQKYIEGLQPIYFHAPFADLCPGSSDPMVREVAKNRYELAYQTANKLGITNMIVHIGWIPGAGVIQRWADRCIDFWNEFLEWKSEKMNFYIENQFDLDPEMLMLMIDGIHKSNVKVCLDIGHVHCHSNISVIDRITQLQDRIGYVHIHDNHGEKDEHLELGKGNIPIREVLSALQKYAPKSLWGLECEIDESMERLKQNDFL